jgi:DNA-binding XRE family transcriptional regulator
MALDDTVHASNQAHDGGGHEQREPIRHWEPWMGMEAFRRFLRSEYERQRGNRVTPPPPQSPMTGPKPEQHLLTFGDHLLRLRRARGWTQAKVASYMGVCTRTIIRHEREKTKHPQSATLLALLYLERGICPLDLPLVPSVFSEGPCVW